MELDAIRRDVEALAALVRDSAGPGERASAAWLAGRLAEAGATDVRVAPFPYVTSWASAQVPHYLAGLAAAALGGGPGGALALAALASFELDFGGRSQWLRPLLPRGEGANVLARVPSRRQRERTLVLVAHHDAAQTGLLWASPLLAAGRERAERRGRSTSLATGSELGLALVAAGSLAGLRAPRLAGAALLGLATFLALDVALGDTVPGASDNASGVAAVLELVRGFAAEPLERTEVVVLLPGCEEPGMGGMAAWLRAEGAGLDPDATLVLGLDTLGAGEPVVLDAEGPVRPERYRARDLAWADRGAERAGLARPRRFRVPGWTDPVLAAIAGLPALSLLSIRDGGFTNYHLPTDVPEHVDWDSVEACTRLAAGIAQEWDAHGRT